MMLSFQPLLWSFILLVTETLSQTTSQSVYIQPSPRVAGLGWGLFSCLIIGSCLLLLCLGLSGEDAAGTVYTVSALVFIAWVLALVYFPKVPVGSIDIIPNEVDWSNRPRIAFFSLLSLCSIGASGGVFAFYIMTPVHAIKPEE